MGGVGHVREGEDWRMPNGQSEAQIAFGIDWGVARPSQSPLQAKKNFFVLVTLWSPDSSN